MRLPFSVNIAFRFQDKGFPFWGKSLMSILFMMFTTTAKTVLFSHGKRPSDLSEIMLNSLPCWKIMQRILIYTTENRHGGRQDRTNQY